MKASSGIREVQWEYAKDYPAGLGGDEYYFGITLTKVSGSSSLWYYIGGGLIVVVGVVAYLMFGKKTTAATDLPPAPGRPAQ